MALTISQIKLLYSEFISLGLSIRDPLGNMTKGDIRDTVDAIYNWIIANQASFNSAIPQPARTELTVKQKNYILQIILENIAKGVI